MSGRTGKFGGSTSFGSNVHRSVSVLLRQEKAAKMCRQRCVSIDRSSSANLSPSCSVPMCLSPSAKQFHASNVTMCQGDIDQQSTNYNLLREECVEVPYDACQIVPRYILSLSFSFLREECEQVERQQCSLVPREACRQVPR